MAASGPWPQQENAAFSAIRLFSVVCGDSDEGNRDSELIANRDSGIDVISRRSEATLALAFSKK
jgi:hypothetical protein